MLRHLPLRTQSRIPLLIVLVFSLFLIAYYPVFKILVSKWAESEEYSHAFLTLPIIIYMAYLNKNRVTETPVTLAPLGFFLLLFSSALYYFSLLTEVHTIIALAMFCTIIGTIIFLFGMHALRVLATPLLLLLLLIPFPDQLYIQLTFPLQLKVSELSAFIINLFDIPVFRSGNVLTIPEKSFEVIEACSGLRSVITLLTLSIIVGYFTLRQPAAKCILFILSIPVAIFINLIRVVAIVLLFHYFRWDLYQGTLHTITGLFLFLIALGVLFILQRILELWEQKQK